MDILVTYDINTETPAGERRLTRAAAVCERAQYSVFECRLSETRLARVMAELRAVIDTDLGSINIYRFAGDIATCRTSLGQTRARHSLGDPWIV